MVVRSGVRFSTVLYMTHRRMIHSFKINRGDYKTLKNRFGVNDHDIEVITENRRWDKEMEFHEVVEALAESHEATFTTEIKDRKIKVMELE